MTRSAHLALAACLLLTVTGCIVGSDGPRVMSDSDAQARFRVILLARLAVISPGPLPYAVDAPMDSAGLCRRHRFYRTSDVDACEQILWSVPAGTEEEWLVNYVVARALLCRLAPVNYFNAETPFEGEVRFCSTVGMEEG